MCLACAGRARGFHAEPAEPLVSPELTDIVSNRPNASVETLSSYLTAGYWAWTGGGPRKWANPNVTYNINDLTVAERQLALLAMITWSDIANISFTFSPGTAGITFINDFGGAYADTLRSGGSILRSTINVSSTWSGGNKAIDSYTFQTYIHEVGHAIGLGHQGPYNGASTYGVNNIYANDTWQYSVMSYHSQQNFDGGSYRFVMTPQMADIHAVQQLYGARTTTRTDNTVYGFNSNAGWLFDFNNYTLAPALTLYDAGGFDTLDASRYGWNQRIDLGPGAYSSVGGLINNIGIYLTTVIEAAVGGFGADIIAGNNVANLLRGNAGADSLDGRMGHDTLDGGDGNDSLLGSSGDDSLFGGAGRDEFHGGDGNDIMLGGTDADVAVFRDASRAYTFSQGGGFLTVTHSGAGIDSVDRLAGIESLRFLDGTFAISDLFISFFPNQLGSGSFGVFDAAGGWTSQDRFPRSLADVNGDGRADIVGFGNQGAWVALANQAGGFGPMRLTSSEFGALPAAGAWESNSLYPRMLADMNGDGRADIVGFGNAGVWIALATAEGSFQAARLAFGQFGVLPQSGGWTSQNIYPRFAADMNGDRLADLVGFGNAGVWVALANGAGGFRSAQLATATFGVLPDAGGWTDQGIHPRAIADVNGDGRGDIVGFGNAGVWLALADSAGGFQPPQLSSKSFGALPSAGGWTSSEVFPRIPADINGDRRSDIVGFGLAGTFTSAMGYDFL